MKGFVETNDYNYSSSLFIEKLPKSKFDLSNHITVESAWNELYFFYQFHKMCMFALAGWIIQIEEFEVKLELARHVYIHANIAKQLRKRGLELRNRTTEWDKQERRCNILFEEIKSSPNLPCFIVALFKVVLPIIVSKYEKYLKESSNILDMPTHYMMKHLLIDLNELMTYGDSLIAVFQECMSLNRLMTSWSEHMIRVVNLLLFTMTPPSEDELSCLRHKKFPFQRKTNCGRDARFATFSHTRDYSSADEYSTNIKDVNLRKLFDMIRTQRDEIDAIETFANVLHDFADKIPFDFQYDLARFIWDESRHAEIGQNLLAHLGYDPFSIPCGLIGINVRSQLSPDLAFAQINIFGESNLVRELVKTRDLSYEMNDMVSATSFDFIHSDEVNHLRRGRMWLKSLSPSFEDIKNKARNASQEQLIKQGILNEDYVLNLTDSEIGMIIGE